MNLKQTFKSKLDGLFAQGTPKRLALAVSGGGDSMALLCLAHVWAVEREVELFTATVNHGLRPEAESEAEFVKQVCCELGVQHETLVWQGWDGRGNLQDEARRARIQLIGDWAEQYDISDVATGHTRDDQAETVLMRLARGAGVDGMSAIPEARQIGSTRWLRPLLGIGREDLRALLQNEGVDWREDASNEDRKYDRVKVRQAMSHLATLGISQEVLAETANRMRQARTALEVSTQDAANSLAKCENGGVSLKCDDFFRLPAEIRRRLLVHTLNWVSCAEYTPRTGAVRDLLEAICEKRTSTLHGCLVTATEGQIQVWRELNAIEDNACKTSEIWDNRWQFHGPHKPDLTVRALGRDGLLECDDWRQTGIKREGLIVSPAIWRKNQLIAAPLAKFGKDWSIKAVKDQNDYVSSIISH